MATFAAYGRQMAFVLAGFLLGALIGAAIMLVLTLVRVRLGKP